MQHTPRPARTHLRSSESSTPIRSRGAGCSTLLHGLGIDVIHASTARESLPARGERPRELACLIVDLLLPGMSGLELLRRLRSAGNDVPVILLADESDVPTAVAAMREGATDFIEKPYVDVAVLKQVQKLLRGQSGSGAAPELRASSP
ncbi:MAG: response regulator [Comamonadaceae bacterium]|nr:response regulator [Comamonadaceae bacterium]